MPAFSNIPRALASRRCETQPAGGWAPRIVPCAVAAPARSTAASSERPAGAIAKPAQQAQNDFRSFRLEGTGAVSADAESSSDGRLVEPVKENADGSIFIIVLLCSTFEE